MRVKDRKVKWESLEELKEARHILDSDEETKWGFKSIDFRKAGYDLRFKIFRLAYDSCEKCLTNKHAYVERGNGSYPEGEMICGKCEGNIRSMDYG